MLNLKLRYEVISIPDAPFCVELTCLVETSSVGVANEGSEPD